MPSDYINYSENLAFPPQENTRNQEAKRDKLIEYLRALKGIDEEVAYSWVMKLF